MGSGGSTGKAEQHGGQDGVKALPATPTVVAVKPKAEAEQGTDDQKEPEPEDHSVDTTADNFIAVKSVTSLGAPSVVSLGPFSGLKASSSHASPRLQTEKPASQGAPSSWSGVRSTNEAPGAAHIQGYSVSSSSSAKPVLRAGMAVRIVGLENATHLNGKSGVLRNWDSELGRWVVRLTNGEEKGIRAVNVTPIHGPSGSSNNTDVVAGSDDANKGLEGLLLQTNWSAIYQLFHQRYGIYVLDKVERGHVVKSAVEMSLSIVAKCFALLRSDPSGRLHCTPLHIAALQSSIEAAEVIVRDLPQLVEQTHKPSHQALCPLHIAILTDSQPIVELLLEGRADPNVRTLHDICPIHLAAMISKNMCQALISHSAEPLRRDVMGSTAVHYAATFKQQLVVEILTQASPKLASECDQKRVSPLHISCAMYICEEDLVSPMTLLATGAKPWQTDVSGASPRDVVPRSQNSALTNFFETNGDRVQAPAQQWLDQWHAAHDEKQDNNDAEEESRMGYGPEGGATDNAHNLGDAGTNSMQMCSPAETRAGSNMQSSAASTEEAMRLAREATAVEVEGLKEAHAAEMKRLKEELAQSNEERARLEQSLVSQRESVEAMQALSEETLAQYKLQLEEAQRRQAEERLDWDSRQRLLLASAREEGRTEGMTVALHESAQQLQEKQRVWDVKREELEGLLQDARDAASVRRLEEPPELEFGREENGFQKRDSLGVTLSGFGNKLAGFGSNLGHDDATEAKQQVMELSEEVKRLEELHEQQQASQSQEIKSLQEELHKTQEESVGNRSRRVEIDAELERLRADAALKLSEAKALQDQLLQAQDQSRQLQEEASALRGQKAEAENRCQQLTLDRQEADNRGKIREIESEKRIADLERGGAQRLADASAEVESAKARAEALEAQCSQMQPLIEKLKERIVFLESQFAEEQTMRKKFHNQIQDMKGAIRVFCRFRPLVEREKSLGDAVAARKVDAFTAEVAVPVKDHSHEQKARPVSGKPFQFDAVFDSEASQNEIFADCRELVQSAVDGYNVTIFAYGQTGAGKTWTMYGNEQNPGLAPRSIESLFGVIQKEQQKGGKTFNVKAYMIELYKQDIIDLLADNNPNQKARGLEVKRDVGRGMMYVEGVTERIILSPDELKQTMADGEKRRHVTATKMNSASSRSHLLLSIIIECKVKEPEQVVYGKITLCDLAGSERPKKSDVSGDGLKECIEINKSLSALGDVIEALTKGSKSVPYRNHKLTMLMQDSLGGTAKTLMFVNCSPAGSNAEETTTSLKWASRARAITNDVKRNADTKEVARLKQVITMMSQAQNVSDGLADHGGQDGAEGDAVKQSANPSKNIVD